MFSERVVENLGNSSFIRAMFEEGEKLRNIYGADKVFDFSIGNPDTEPPLAVKEAMVALAKGDAPGIHRYMSNAGFADVREKVAGRLHMEYGITVPADNIIMTCGAAAGLNVALKSVLNPGDEVIVFSPYFVEYLFYIDNHGGKPVIVPVGGSTFEPDPGLLRNHISRATKAIIINSPNNPTGVVYGEDTLKRIAAVIEDAEEEFGTTIFVISDQPYDKIVYDNVKVPSILEIFRNSILINSFSKSLALPGERIGYIAVSNAIKEADLLVSCMVFCNRTLGFVNAPALMQKVIAGSIDATVDIDEYKKKRDILYNHLTELGFSCMKPQGAFYLFPKIPVKAGNDVKFVKKALKYNLLVVPGKGFGWPGHFRIAYCVSMKTIERSLEAFTALAKEL